MSIVQYLIDSSEADYISRVEHFPVVATFRIVRTRRAWCLRVEIRNFAASGKVRILEHACIYNFRHHRNQVPSATSRADAKMIRFSALVAV